MSHPAGAAGAAVADLSAPDAFDDGPNACANCAAVRLGPFCHACGQLHLSERLSFREIGRMVFTRVFGEEGVVLTLRSLVRDPGGVARAYVRGRRRRYTNPVTFFFLGSTAVLLLFPLVADLYRAQFAAGIEQGLGDPAAREAFTAVFGPDPAMQFAGYVTAFVRQLYSYLMLVVCVPFVLLLRLFFGGAAGAPTLPELSVFALYTFGTAALLSALLMPLAPFVGLGVYGAAGIALYFGMAGHAARGFFGRDARNVLLTLLALAGAYAAYFVFMAGLGAAAGVYIALQAVG